jgi:hypothetical protein
VIPIDTIIEKFDARVTKATEATTTNVDTKSLDILWSKTRLVSSKISILKKKHILEELEIEKDIADVVGNVKYTWDAESIINQNLDKFANILCDIFPIEKETADKVVSKANEWAGTRYSTPSWDMTREFVMDTVRTEHLSQSIGHDSLSLFRNNVKMIEEIVTETFVRAIFYNNAIMSPEITTKRIRNTRRHLTLKLSSIRSMMLDGATNPKIMTTLNIPQRTFYRYMDKIYQEDRIELAKKNKQTLATHILLLRERLMQFSIL